MLTHGYNLQGEQSPVVETFTSSNFSKCPADSGGCSLVSYMQISMAWIFDRLINRIIFVACRLLEAHPRSEVRLVLIKYSKI